MSVLQPVLALLDDPAALAARWHEQDLFTTVGANALVVTVGAPDPAALESVGQRFEAATGRALPPLLVQLLARYDGYDLDESTDGRSVQQLGVGADGHGLCSARGLELETTPGEDEHLGLRIGRVYHQASILWMLEGPQAGAVVYLDEDADEPQVLGESLERFFERLAATGLSIEALIRRTHL